MGTEYIVAGVIERTQRIITFCVVSFIIICLFMHTWLIEWKGPTITDLGDGNVQIVTRVHHRQAGWLLVTNMFYVGKNAK